MSQKDCTEDKIEFETLDTFDQISKFAEGIAKEHNISHYTIQVLIYQDGTRQVEMKSFIENYKVTILLTPPFNF